VTDPVEVRQSVQVEQVIEELMGEALLKTQSF
jgi:hypothetical protein